MCVLSSAEARILDYAQTTPWSVIRGSPDHAVAENLRAGLLVYTGGLSLVRYEITDAGRRALAAHRLASAVVYSTTIDTESP